MRSLKQLFNVGPGYVVVIRSSAFGFKGVALLCLCAFLTSACLAEDAPKLAPQLNPSLRAYLQRRLTNAQDGPDKSLNVLTCSVPLKNGNKETLVYLRSHGWCGTGGCTLLILESQAAGYKSLGTVTITQLPVSILNSMTNGHSDVLVHTHGGGLLHDNEVVLSFDGKRYPSNPTLLPSRKKNSSDIEGATLSATDEGILLF